MSVILDEDRNFALEEYGRGSKCFEHGESMWEERSCGQVRKYVGGTVMWSGKLT